MLFSVFLFSLLILAEKSAEAQQQSFDVMECVRSSQSAEAMLECGNQYIAVWEDRMELSLQQLDALLPEARQIMLDHSQNAWNEYRVSQVNLSDTIHFGSGDTMNNVLAKIREARLYQQRTEFLDELITIQQNTSRENR